MPTLAFVMRQERIVEPARVVEREDADADLVDRRDRSSSMVSETASVPFLSARRSVNGEARLDGSGNGSRAGKSA